MVHVGTPGCRHLYGRTVADATTRGLRLISYDRPGYGDSTPQPGRTMADCASDARIICTALGIDRLAMWGLSGGAREGVWDDCRAQIIPWGFSVHQISIPVLLMHGRLDKAVPFGHGQWLAAHIPGVEARLFDDEGHGTLRENRIGEVHAWLAARL